MDEILDLLNAPCKQWKTVMSNICEASGLKGEMRTYATCPGHMAFVPDQISDEIPCSECGNAALSEMDPKVAYQYLPLVPRLRAMVERSVTREELYAYRRSRHPEPGSFRDYFDGDAYRTLSVRLGGEEQLKDDIFILPPQMDFLRTRTETTMYGLLQQSTSTSLPIKGTCLKTSFR